jgi:uncharacterized membrane protein YfcA
MKAIKFITERKLFFFGILVCTLFAFLSAKPQERPAWEQALVVFLFGLFGFLVKELYLKYPQILIIKYPSDFIKTIFWIMLSLTALYFIQKTF